ncbi:unnamed protein product [Didymodactylos carnosus]|uniref:Uncharacterized protein n=1 Tax=Didymodactylos carnosus TaxID=1234261 RepID=A0A815NN02_9BILA|nr:unnamed protein product [Didymodactylos carnosus]CAF1436760.1 unnamed protein product [Didymodactylos carnosus]CAF4073975.1 unnamed protein product [Didymodactylos carnosus]CAF4314195.1 unnamed protein product [Didymodactylos carnosus]
MDPLLVKSLEYAYNQTYPGVTFYYRDADISHTLLSKYTVNQILKEPRPVDMSSMGGKLVKNTRYLIASNMATKSTDLGAQETRVRHLLVNSYFKILSIIKRTKEDQTQLLLLHIPSDCINIFKTCISNLDKYVISKGLQSFNEKQTLKPIPQLQTKQWCDRTAFPIGMSSNGDFFYCGNNTKQL